MNPIKSSTALAVAELPPVVAAPKPAGGQIAPASGVKRVSFGKIAKKTEETKTAYPVFPDADGQAAIIAARILERTAKIEALTGSLDTDKAELKMRATPFYFSTNAGRQEIPSSVSVATTVPDPEDNEKTIDAEVLVSFINRYGLLPDDAPLVGILGERTDTFFRQSFEVKITGDKLPTDKTQELMEKLQALFDEYGALDALEVKDGFKPNDDFHTKRHLELTVQENLAVDQVCPVSSQVKTKGRKK